MENTLLSNDYTPLMRNRIRRLLLVCSNYDSFVLEEDGRVDTRISEEYAALNLTNPPTIVRSESAQEALEMIHRGEQFDLIITMHNAGTMDVYEFAQTLKQINSSTPVVLLTPFSRVGYRQLLQSDTSNFDEVFCWNNSTDLIIAIIKLLEDRMNAEYDILHNGVQAILLVEDSIRYYSTYLPMLYTLLLKQNAASLKDTLNEHQQIFRKRSRPKILMAKNLQQASTLYNQYKNNILGVISDVGFVEKDGDDPNDEMNDAGIQLCHMIRSDNPKMPFVLQSSQESMGEIAKQLGVGFVLKTSKTLTHELTQYIEREFGFGDFIVKDPDDEDDNEIARAGDLHGVEHLVKHLSDNALAMLFQSNYFSKWFLARGMFQIGNQLKTMTEKNNPNVRKDLYHAIHDYRIAQGLGVVAKYDSNTYNDAIRFARVGDGSLGGKARGLAFLNHILLKYHLFSKWNNVRVLVPRTFVITTDVFDEFILENGLQYVINGDLSDEEILSEFIASALPRSLTDALRHFIRTTKQPLAVRSSSKLEDSYYQPFAGVYSTYMIPRTENEDQQLRLLSKAIKSVYASIYFASSRGYIASSANVISEEKMAVVLQEVCGSEENGYFFPTLSGVARSVNFYPIGHEKAEEGIVKLAFGLGKAVVDGGKVLRFSPYYPRHVLQTSTDQLIERDTQRTVYALNLKPDKFKTSVDDGVNLEKLDVSKCHRLRNMKHVASSWDPNNMCMVDAYNPNSANYITFAPILKYDTFPLADILIELMDIAKKEMKCGVEIEFAANLDVPSGYPTLFNILQIRPISADSRQADVNWNDIDDTNALIQSYGALGTGWIEGIQDVIYIRPEAFDVRETEEIAREVRQFNDIMRRDNGTNGNGYILIGYGRWGSSIPALGVPVKWGDISEAKVIVECCLDNFRVEPSQGTHFFQNMTSFNVGYMDINPYVRKDRFNIDVLNQMDALHETKHLRHVRFEKPLQICIDGKSGRGMVK